MCDTWSADMTHLPLTPPSHSPALQGWGLLSPLSAAAPLSLPTCSEVSWPVPPHAAQSPPLLEPADCSVPQWCSHHCSLQQPKQLASGSIQPAINVL